MKNFNLGVKIMVGFLIILLMFISISIISNQSILRLNKDAQWVTHTHEVLNDIELITSTLKDTETGQRGFIITGSENYLEPYNLGLENLNRYLNEIESLTADNPNQQKRINQLRVLIKKKLDELAHTIELRRDSGFEEARQVVMTDLGKKVMDEIRVVLKDMKDEEENLLENRQETSLKQSKQVRLTMLFVIIGALIIVIALVAYYISIIANPLKDLADIASHISNGDLNSKIKIRNSLDEVGKLTRAFEEMQTKLKRQLNDINEGVNVLSSSSSEIMASISQLSSGAAETATSVSETTSTIAEVKQTAEVSNQKANDVSQKAEESVVIANNGNQAILENLEGMNEIKNQMNSIAEIVIGLSEKSQSIGDIVTVVNDIAEQSNLLAVNASIEAAKAGEHGKGFNVVAQEIKNLASKSKESTKQIKALLNDVQKSISNTVMATEQGSKTVDSGFKLSEESQKVINQLADNIEEFAQVAIQIAASSQQQLIGMDQINDAMESVSEASAATAASTRQSEESVKELHGLGEKLQEILKSYKLS